MKKAICIIAANCQGAYLKALLSSSPEFDSRFEIKYFVNYNHEVVPRPLLKACELLIYQPLGPKWGDLSSGKLLARVGPECVTISINYLTFPVYWPFMANDKRNSQTEDYPFGQFPYGDSKIIDLLEQKLDPSEIFDRYVSREYMLPLISPEKIIKSYSEKQIDLEERRDQKVLNYILSNFRNIKLFETFNHPSLNLCLYQANDLLAKLGMQPLAEDQIPPLSYLQDNEQPIHPMVAEALELKFDCNLDTSYNVWKKPMTFTEYTRAYISWDVSAIGKQITLPPKQAPTNIPAESAKTPLGNKKPSNPQIVFLHIPKTAGSSLNKMLSKAFDFEENYVHYNSTLNLVKDTKRKRSPLILGHINYDALSILSTERKVITFLREPISRTLSAYEFMKSHPETWLGKLAQGSITEFLNHPAVERNLRDVQTRMLGLELNFKKPYAALISGRIDKQKYFKLIQLMAKRQAGPKDLERAKERLAKIDFIGFTESFDEDARDLFKMLEKPCETVARTNVTDSKFKKRRQQYTDEEIDLVRSLNEFDIQLYEAAKIHRNLRNSNED